MFKVPTLCNRGGPSIYEGLPSMQWGRTHEGILTIEKPYHNRKNLVSFFKLKGSKAQYITYKHIFYKPYQVLKTLEYARGLKSFLNPNIHQC